MGRVILLLLLLTGCAAPIGSKAVNPACLIHCTVEVVDAGAASKLTTLTLGANTTTGGQRSTTTTTTGP